jgi:RNA polymerase sigma-70 factor (ECF subfamily)
MRDLADGDRSAFDLVWSQAAPKVRNLCARLLGAGPDADDAAQAALIKVFERIAEYDTARPALPWILGVAAWECRTQRKRRARSREFAGEPGVEAPTGTVGPEQRLIDADLERALFEVMGGLRPEDREVLEACLDEMRPEGATFRKRVQRAIARLRLAWGERHDLG